ncbi:tRNA:m(4)X modification enzyme TRM13 homolog [Pelobates fuscus]|uniref:tRNA:m(4)X modification enzyme TRM13 homolog n=1 Tax=Pelobates fuscus TaxID=191477 RepID=UPI002FE4C0DD
MESQGPRLDVGPPANPVPGRCSYFVQRKRRFCKMVVSEGKRLCGEHAQHGEEQNSRKRIPCPLDPKHTVYEDQLQKHLKKCNSREKPLPVFYMHNVNAGSLDRVSCEEQVAISSMSQEDLHKFIEILVQVTTGLNTPLPDKKLSHWALQEALNDPVNGESAAKHLKQQASILGHLDSLGLLGGSRCFVEFGAGRGKLSHWVDIALQDAENVHFLLVERATTRFKVDGKQRKSTFERLHIDIQHLCLDRVPSLVQKQLPVIGIGKHLCGAGTDLALRCLAQTYSSPLGEPQCKRPRLNPTGDSSDEKESSNSPLNQYSPVEGIVLALCCHHRCDWQFYVGRDFFENLGLGQREFNICQRMSSWATCGFHRLATDAGKKNDQEDEEDNKDEQNNLDCNSETIQRFLTVDEREHLGRLCKLLIDQGRLHYLQSMGYRPTLHYYTDPEVSLENVLLAALP